MVDDSVAARAGCELEGVYRAARDELVGVIAAIVGNRDEAQELAQEAAIRLFAQDRAVLRDPKAFLFFAGANLARDHLRRARVRSDYLRDAAHEPMPEVARPDDVHAVERGLGRIEQALACLTPRVRQVVWLSRVEGHTNAEVARRLALADKTVEKHLARGLAKLAHLLRPGVGAGDARASEEGDE